MWWTSTVMQDIGPVGGLEVCAAGQRGRMFHFLNLRLQLLLSWPDVRRQAQVQALQQELQNPWSTLANCRALSIPQ
jgi:hypothetical protein